MSIYELFNRNDIIGNLHRKLQINDIITVMFDFEHFYASFLGNYQHVFHSLITDKRIPYTISVSLWDFSDRVTILN